MLWVLVGCLFCFESVYVLGVIVVGCLSAGGCGQGSDEQRVARLFSVACNNSFFGYLKVADNSSPPAFCCLPPLTLHPPTVE